MPARTCVCEIMFGCASMQDLLPPGHAREVKQQSIRLP